VNFVISTKSAIRKRNREVNFLYVLKENVVIFLKPGDETRTYTHSCPLN
jgi:hypothetical protein